MEKVLSATIATTKPPIPMIKDRLYRLLRWSERYTKTDMVYLTQGSFWLTAGQAVAAVASFALSIAFANFLSQDTYGSYKYILSIASILAALSLTGLSTAVTQSTSRGYEGTVRHAFKTSLKWSLPLMFAALGVGVYYLVHGQTTFAGAMLVVALTTPLINSASLYSSLLSGKRMFKENTLYWAIGVFASTAAVAYTVYLTDNLLAIVTTYFVSNAIVNLVAYRYTLATVRPAYVEDSGSTRYSVNLSVINLLNTITSQIDKILVFHYLGAAQVAIYAFALAMPDQIRAALKSSARLALPKFAGRSFGSIQETLGLRLVRFGMIVVALIVAYVLAAPFIFRFLFPAYTDSIFYSQVLSLTILTVLGTIPITALQAHAKERSLYAHTIVTNALQVTLLIIFIRSLGLAGAVTALLLNRFISLFFAFYLFKNVTEEKEKPSS